METNPNQALPDASIRVQGDVNGSIVYGNNNFVVNKNHGTIVYNAPRPRVTRHPATPPIPRAPTLFLNRENEVRQASEFLANYQPVSLIGSQGIGKTTLIKQIAHGLPMDKFPDGVIFVDGEWEGLISNNLNDVVQNIFDSLYDSNPPLKVTIASARTYLGNIKALLILDHVTLSPKGWSQLPDLFPAGGLLWAVPYRPPAGTTKEIALAGLPAEEAVQLFMLTIGLGLEDSIPRSLYTICERLYYHPLAIITVARWVRAKEIPLSQVLETLSEQSDREEEPVGFALEKIVGALEGSEKELFSLAASAGGAVINQDILIKASGLESSLAASSLVNLEKMGLLQAHGPGLGMHPSYKNYSRQRLQADDRQTSRLAQQVIDDVNQRGGSQKAVDEQFGNLLGVFEHGLQTGRIDLAGTAATLIAPKLVLEGKWDLWDDVFNRIVRSTERHSDKRLRGRAYHELGTNQLAMGHKEEAIHNLTQARDIRLSIGDKVGAAYTQHNLNMLIGPPPPPLKPDPRPHSQPRPKPDPSWPKVITGIILGGGGLIGIVAVIIVLVAFLRDGSASSQIPITPGQTDNVAITETFINSLPNATRTPTSTPPRLTPTSSRTPTRGPTATRTSTFTPTPSKTPTYTPTYTVTPSITPTKTSTQIPPPSGQIIFTSGRSGDRELYIMNANGTNLTRMTYTNGDDSRPAWRPDGLRIAFAASRDGDWDIYIMNNSPNAPAAKLYETDGANEFNPRYSPDEDMIAFTSNSDGDYEIYVYIEDQIEGDYIDKLTNNSAADGCPDWSPNGNKIAFSSNRDGNNEIYVMNADGSNQTRLTNNSAFDNCPTWSPDGQTFAFRSERDGDSEIWLMDADGSNQRQLTHNNVEDWGPAHWSPDGNWLTFLSNRGNWEIIIISVDGSSEINLTKNAAYDAYPDWSP
jgi:hypothetical protein